VVGGGGWRWVAVGAGDVLFCAWGGAAVGGGGELFCTWGGVVVGGGGVLFCAWGGRSAHGGVRARASATAMLRGWRLWCVPLGGRVCHETSCCGELLCSDVDPPLGLVCWGRTRLPVCERCVRCWSV